MKEAEIYLKKIERLQEEIKDNEDNAKQKKEELRQIKEQDFPLFLLENGLKKYEATDGTKVSYSASVHASTNAERRPEAVQLLGKYRLASAFKYELKLSFPLTAKGEIEDKEIFDTIKKLLRSNGLSFNEDYSAHYKTLEKAASDLMGLVNPEDEERARELLSITDYYRTTITRKKEN